MMAVSPKDSFEGTTAVDLCLLRAVLLASAVARWTEVFQGAVRVLEAARWKGPLSGCRRSKVRFPPPLSLSRTRKTFSEASHSPTVAFPPARASASSSASVSAFAPSRPYWRRGRSRRCRPSSSYCSGVSPSPGDLRCGCVLTISVCRMMLVWVR